MILYILIPKQESVNGILEFSIYQFSIYQFIETKKEPTESECKIKNSLF